MELVTPDIGLLFWMLLSFSIVLLILKRFAWKPILTALKNREDSIEEALEKAQLAREKTEQAKTEVEKMIIEGRVEKERLLKQAKEDIVTYKRQAQERVDEQMSLQLKTVNQEIDQQKRVAIEDLKTTVASLAVEISEKILKKELDDTRAHDDFIKDSIKTLDI
jgi:F-type H+-transporting ATPase subunit b